MFAPAAVIRVAAGDHDDGMIEKTIEIARKNESSNHTSVYFGVRYILNFQNREARFRLRSPFPFRANRFRFSPTSAPINPLKRPWSVQ